MTSVTKTLKSLLSEGPAERMVLFSSMPEDMQQLILDFASLDEECEKFSDLENGEDFSFKVYDVPTKLFPNLDVASKSGSSDSRDEAHAMAIPLSDERPIVLIGDDWVDGRHRVFKAKRLKVRSVPAINLNELGVHRVVNSLGRLTNKRSQAHSG